MTLPIRLRRTDTARTWPRRLAALTAATALVGMAGPAGAAAAPVRPDPPIAPITVTAGVARPVPLTAAWPPELVASAQPTADDPQVADNQTRAITVTRPGKAASVATAAATCDGCTGTAAAAATFYFPLTAEPVRADNVATAWNANCEGCTVHAVSIQIVTARTATDVHVTNRALALNAGCTSCASTAVAIQYVLLGVGPKPPRPGGPTPNGQTPDSQIPDGSPSGQIAAQIQQTLRSAPADQQRAAVLADAQRGRSDLQQRYGATTATVTVDFQTG